MNKNNFDASKLNYIIYCRKSSDTEDKQVQSLETQHRELTEYAKRNSLNVVKIIQESKSAFKVGRQGFGEMLELIRNGHANAILVVRANRISRNVMDSAYVISLMDEKLLMYVRTPSSSCYTCFGNDKFMLGLEFIVSKKDSDDKGEMVKEGLKTKALRGLPSGVASLGFLNDKTEEKGRRNWFVDKERFDAIKILFEMFLTGTYSAGKLHKYAVQELKLTTVKRKKIGGAFITLSRIYEILKDPIYAGFFYQGNVKYELDSSLPRIITEDLHNKVKTILSRKNIPKVQHNEATFAGFMQSNQGEFMGQDVKYQLICDCKKKFGYLSKTHCPKCEKEIEQLENPKYLSFTYYYNVKKKKSSQKYKSIEEAKITKQLVDFADSYLTFSPELAEWSKSYITELKNKEINESVFRKEKEQLDMEEYAKKKGRLREMLREKYITPEEYKGDLELLDNQYKVTEKKHTNADWYTKMNEIVDLTQSARDIFAKGTMQAKRVLLSNMSSNLVWNEKELFINNDISINKLVECIKGIKSKYPEFEPKNYIVPQGLNEKTSEFSPVFSSLLGR